MAYFIKNPIGIWGEKLACEKYLKRGFVLVARNIYNRRGKMLGELDLVVRSHKHLVFVEVKTRTSEKFGAAVASITKQKQRKLINTIKWFCRKFPQYNHLSPRIDVCAITIDRLDKSRVNVIIIPSAVTLDY